jgi:predicted ATPase/class 3 adenylate cyclase
MAGPASAPENVCSGVRPRDHVAMPELPRGTVTLLFTDIEGSTRLLHALGERYSDVLAEHRRVLRDAFSCNGGVEVDTQGDAFFVAFTRATDAVAAARDAQAALGEGPVRVRIGIHTGEPLVTEEGYVGVDVHRAARIMSAAHGGQVLVSEATRPLIDTSFVLRDLGEHRLKDLSAPQHLYQLGDDAFPPPKTLYLTNLPIQSSAFVGREHELEEAGALLRAHRLITLTGPGGSGKTRLALQLAADAVEQFPDGVFWVPLQALRDPALVERAIAASIGADDGLVEHISSKQLLVLLDNFEQVIEAASIVALLLAATPNAKLLVTSREPLQLEPEQRYLLEPLPDQDAVSLFIERARSVEPGFLVTSTVREICLRLDGLPLAIELAAARVVLLEPDELLARLEQRLPLLASSFRDAPARQRTLRATIAWSYELLDPSETELFRRLAVFRGSFSLEAAEAICNADLDLLESLVVKSLVRRWDRGRLGMLDTVREYALERFEEATEADDLRRRHAEFFLDLAETANLNPGTRDPAKPIRHDIARQEQHEMYGALAWALETGAVDLGLRLATSVGGWLWSINHPREGMSYFGRLLENANVDAVPPEILADALREYGAQAFLAGDDHKAERLEEQSLALYEQLGDEHGRAVMLHRLGIAALWAGDLDRARALAEESRAIHDQRGDEFGVGETLGLLGAIAREAGDDALAYELIGQSAAIARAIGGGFTDWWASGMLAELACLSLRAGRVLEAQAHAREALALADQLHYRAGRVFGVGVLAAVAAARDQLEHAQRLWTAVEREDAVAPLGGWRRHRQACEALVRQGLGPEFTRADAANETLNLDGAVRLALDDVGSQSSSTTRHTHGVS